MKKVVKLSDNTKTVDYFPVSVSEAIYHKDKENKVIPVSEAINKIENGSTKVKKAEQADNASVANAIKDENTGKDKTWSDIDAYIGQEIGDASEEIYAAIQKLKDDIAGGSVDITIPMASDAADGYGISRLAKLEDVTSQNDSSSNDASIAVSPNTLWRYINSLKGVNSGIASLGDDGKVPSSQLPSYVDDVIEVANYASLPTRGESGKIYVTIDTRKTYRWGGTEYAEISASLAIGTTEGTAYDGASGQANANAISSLQTKVSTAETDIANLKTKDESHDQSLLNLDTNKAEKSTVDTLQGEVSGIKTTANDNAAVLNRIIGTGIPDTDYGDNNNTQSVALAIRAIGDDDGKQISTTYATKTQLDGIEVGGRNLIRNGDFSRGSDEWSPWGYSGNINVTDKVATFTLNQAQGVLQTSPFAIEKGKSYVVSFDIKSGSITSLNYCYLMSSAGNIWMPAISNITTSWQRIVYKFTGTTTGTYMFGFGVSGVAGANFQITKVKIETGNKATDWTPAPEDVQTQIDFKLSLSGGTLTGSITAPTYKGTTDKSGVYSESIMSYPSSFASEDLNSERFLKAGMYRLDGVNDTINQPGGRGYGHLMTIRGGNSDNAAQMFFDYFDNGNAYIRTGSTNPNAGDFYILNRAWKQLLEDLVTTSHIADTAITPAKIQTNIALNGTPSMTVEPTTSSPDKTIASVGLAKTVVNNLKIGTRNLLPSSKEITIDGSAITSGSKYITKKLPISVAVGDVLTFSCEDLIINAGTDETHAILLYSGGALATVKYISPTSKTATITVTKASTTPYLYMYAGYSDDSAGKSITYKGATLVKGDKPMLLWQRAEEDLDDVADYTVFPNLISASDLELGGLTDANGSNSTTTSATRARSAGYIPVSAPKITLKSWTDGVVFYLWTYDANKNPLQMSFSSTNWVSAKYTYTLPTGTAYIRVVMKKTSGANFTAAELPKIKIKAEDGSKATAWQPSADDMQVSRPTVYYQSAQPTNAVNGDIWIIS